MEFFAQNAEICTEAIVVLVVLANLKILGSSRLMACIKMVAFQGIVLGLLPLVALGHQISVRMVCAACASLVLKGVVFPWLMVRAVRDVDARREVEPIVGYTTSLVAGLGMIAASLWLGSRLGPLPLATPAGSFQNSLVVPAALLTLMVGLFMIVARKKAVTQVLGYLCMENGIYTFGMTVAENEPLLVELGILLDVFMAVFVMGIAIYHINREFDHIDTEQMSALKD